MPPGFALVVRRAGASGLLCVGCPCAEVKGYTSASAELRAALLQQMPCWLHTLTVLQFPLQSTQCRWAVPLADETSVSY